MNTLKLILGMILMGKRGMASAISHAPRDCEGKTRFVFFAFPHIGIHSSGELGLIRRLGMSENSSVCGAILALQKEMQDGSINYEIDPLDIEYSHLKHKLLTQVPYGHIPSRSEITMVAYQTIVKDLEALIEVALSESNLNVDYAVFTGIQIHHADLHNFVWPGTCYAIKDGVREDLVFPWTEKQKKLESRRKRMLDHQNLKE
eukprot:TRINITY_DN14462_c0_g1_i3.p1 TRINITY_DN14462_c0_g1~~TRINITY_DN14462_c0_g1_i3.p1  ORF type:complete len:203 (-),score=39.97 TRINITY_DN14462_c0_g1_i3:159-767(-)